MSLLRSDLHLADFKTRGSGDLPDVLGIEMTDLAQGRAASRMPLRQLHFAPNGFLHAASVVALADTTCGYASLAHLPAGAESFTTIELKSNHLGTVRAGAIACLATAQHLGRNTQVWDAVVTDAASGRTIALFRCTQMVLWPKTATGAQAMSPST